MEYHTVVVVEIYTHLGGSMWSISELQVSSTPL